MTAVVGFCDGGRVFIGADSAGVAGWSLSVRADQKVFTKGEFAMGFTSSFRMGQLLRYKLQIPVQKESQDVFDYMVTDFVDAVRQCLKDGGYASKHSETESGGTFLVGYRGRLFKIEADYQVGESSKGYDAAGCGEAVCLGALFATSVFPGVDPSERMKIALTAAEQNNAGVRGPFHTVSA